MLRENLNTATRSEQMMTNTGTEHSVSSDTPSVATIQGELMESARAPRA